MNCPECDAWSTVTETRKTPVRYRRRRECGNGHKFTTEETIVPSEQIEKESRERFENARREHVESFRKGRPKNSGNASQKASM
jgi:transcriptional regulator NrdR family protein